MSKAAPVDPHRTRRDGGRLFVDYRFLGRHAYTLFGISVILLLIVSAAGYSTRGSQRWIAIAALPSSRRNGQADAHPGLGKYFDRHQLGRDCRLRS